MPEGVEVKLSKEIIQPLVVGKTISSFEIHQNGRYGKEPLFIPYSSDLKVKEVNTKGKFMYWIFDKDTTLWSTFGMSGQWSPDKGKHPCFSALFTDGTSVTFNDPRHFGTIRFSNIALLEAKLNELGWDPLSSYEQKDLSFVKDCLKKKDQPIGQVLMDQSIFAGVGNYIRAEALYEAGISPWRKSKSLSEDDIINLCDAIVDVMANSYDHQGATILTYKNAYGAEGQYSSCFKVYGKKLDPNGNKITKEKTPDGRTVHWCPAIQN